MIKHESRKEQEIGVVKEQESGVAGVAEWDLAPLR
jgi:hypothetical protein